MKKFLKFLIPLIFILIVIFIFPKQGASGGSCPECETNVCDCFGFEKSAEYSGPWKKICYGIPYDCYPSDSPSNYIFYCVAGILAFLILALFIVEAFFKKNEKPKRI